MLKLTIFLSVLYINLLLMEVHGFSDPYENLNNILIESCGEENYSITDNLYGAENYWHNYREEPKSILHPLKMSALERFIDLMDVYYSKMCAGGALSTIVANEKNSGANKKSIRHVEKVIYKISKEHAEDCLKTYPINYKNDYSKQMSTSIKAFVRTFWNGLILSRENLPAIVDEYSNNLEYNEVLKREDLLVKVYENYIIGLNNNKLEKLNLTKQDMKTIYKALEHLIKNSTTPKDLKYLKDKNQSKINSLLSDYIFKSCKKYINVTDINLFDPAQHDAILLRIDGQDTYNPKNNNEIDYEFYWAWAQYRVCKTIVNIDKKVFLNDFMAANFQ